MAGIGVRLNKIFEKHTLATNVLGFLYSTVVTVAPMLVIILNMVLMQWVLGFSKLEYAARELFSSTMLYTFVFALLTAAPFNAVLSRYVSDVIYEERYEDILPCYYLGMMLNMIFSSLIAIPFCIREHLVGGVSAIYIFAGFCSYITLVLVFYSMTYLSICKDYQRIALYYLIGMIGALLVSLVLRYLLNLEATFSMLVALMIGFLIIAALENALLRQYFKENSNRYKPVLGYFKKYWQLVITNTMYILGLYIHNFVFWMTDTRMVVANSFICNQSYDMASCLAMFTNISANIIFTSRVEMYFNDKYKRFSESVTGGRGLDLENAKKRMFQQIASELMSLVRIQFIISVVTFLIFSVFLPKFGFAGLTLKIYPLLAAAYFILFLMYSVIIFLYYFNDMTGAVITSFGFCITTFLASIVATTLPEIWYGSGLLAGAFVGWCLSYARVRWVEKHIDAHTFCTGTLIPIGKGEKPSAQVYQRKN